MKRDAGSGSLLIVGALSGVAVMLLHPTAHGIMDPESGARMAIVNRFVHGLALFAMPAVFLGLLGLRRRIGSSDLAVAGLVAYAWGCVAVMGAAIASGFVASGVIEHIKAAEGSKIPDAFLLYTSLWNRAFAKVNVVASSLGILLLSAAILRTKRLSQPAGIAGAGVGAVILVLFFAGHIGVDIHGFGIVTFTQAAWLVWVGVLLTAKSD